ncbi:MAG: M23 family metallopeptidase [Chitinispirillaceae bacterium]
MFLVLLGGYVRIFYHVGAELAKDADMKIETSRYIRLSNQENLLTSVAKRMMWTMEWDTRALHLLENSRHAASFSPIVPVSFTKAADSVLNAEQVEAGYSVPSADYFRSPQDTLTMPVIEELSPLVPNGVPCKGIITSHFGTRTDPVFEGTAFHRGIDIADEIGSPVWSTADGRVVFAGTKRYFGNVVMVDHEASGYATVYAHLRNFEVRKGESVTRGRRIGTLGSTGKSTGPHLHYEIRFHGQAVNPLEFMMPHDMVVD